MKTQDSMISEARMRQVLLILLFPALLAAAQSPATLIRKEMTAEAAAWNRGDIDGFMAAYWRSPRTQFIGAGGISAGWATVREHYLKNYPNRAAMGHLTFSRLRVTLLCRDFAYVAGNYRLDRAHDHPAGVFTLLFRRFPEGWRIVSDHTTAFPAPAATPH